MSVGSVCRRPASTVSRYQTVGEAAAQMGRERVGSLVVTEADRPLGVVTDRDIAMRTVGDRKDAASTQVLDIATTPVVSLREEMPLSQASDRMRTHGLRRVPVTDAQGRVVGIVAADDLVQLIADDLMALADVAAEQVPTGVRQLPERPGWRRGVRPCIRDVVSAHASEPVRAAAERMRSEGVGCLVVVDEDEAPCGMLTDRNLTLRVVAKNLDPDATKVASVMTPSVMSVDAGARLRDVARMLSDQGIRRVPVMQDGRLSGIVTYDDLLAALGRELNDLGRATHGVPQERQ